MTAAAPRPPVLLTVCLGNICRSPTAEAALLAAAREAGIALEVRSYGTGSWHLGDPPDRRMRAAAADVGLELRGAAARVDADALRDADLVLTMDADNLRTVTALARDHGIDTPVRRFRVFDPALSDLDDDELDGDALDVPDPYYGGNDGFAAVVAMCRRTAGVIVAQLAAGSAPGALRGRPDPLAP